jgi:hypothetical protein
MPDGEMIWRTYGPGDEPDWLRPSRRRRLWGTLRVNLHRSLGIPLPAYLGHNGAPIGPRRIFRRVRGLS